MFEPEQQQRRYGDTRGPITFDGRIGRGPGPAPTGQEPPRPITPQASDMDSPENRALWKKLIGYYTHELDAQSENRRQMAMDEDFYDSIQFTDEEVATLEARGQIPMVFNITKTTINWVLGSQKRAPKDFRVLPRTKAGQLSAQRKSELLKHVNDSNLAEFEVADAFAQAVKAGMGWLESCRGSADDGSKVIVRAEDWRAMLWDSTARRYDMKDARYIFRTKWLDEDVVAAMWPNRKGVIENSSRSVAYNIGDDDSLGDDAMDSAEEAHFDLAGGTIRRADTTYDRRRIRVIEAWFKIPKKVEVVHGGQFSGELFDPWSVGQIKEINAGIASKVAAMREVIHMAILTDDGFLDLRTSPYRHNQYPFTPIWGYRRSRDGLPYGMIRDIRDPQRDFNRRAAKAQHYLATTRVTVEEGAVDDIEELRDEAARPDAVIVHKTGKAPPQIENNTNLASAHVEMMGMDQQLIQQIGGVTDENLGRRTNASSGIAIERRQNQGALATSTFFDNLRRSSITHGIKTMVLVEMFYDKEDEFRITDSRGNPDFKTINDGTPEGAVAEFKADFVMEEEDWRASARQAQAESLLQLSQQLAATAPQVVIGILDLVVEALDVPKRDELVKRIRNLTGAEDPDADPNNPTPEMQAKQAEAAKMKAMQERQANAAIMEQEAKARKLMAEAAAAEDKGSDAYIARLKAAFEAAIAIAGAPAVAAAADQILADAMQVEASNGGVMPATSPTPEPAAAPQPVPATQPPML